MSAPTNALQLTQLIELCDTLIAGAGDTHAMDYRAHHMAGERLANALRDPAVGARITDDRGAGRAMTLAGIRSSCTGGMFGLVRNWQNAARRKIGVAAK